MTENSDNTKTRAEKSPSLLAILGPYKLLVFGLIVLTLINNGFNLLIPKIIGWGIDDYNAGTLVVNKLVWEFFGVSLVILIFAYAQAVVQTYASEKVAEDLRNSLAEKISHQSFLELQKQTAGKLLTNLTSDMDQVKMFVSNAVASIISSIVLIVGTAILLFMIDWRLALAVLLIIPTIGILFFVVFSRMRTLFSKTQAIIDRLNKTINESILGAALIRVVNAEIPEYNKFLDVNTDAKNTGLAVLRVFSTVIPIVTFVANLAILVILLLGGRFVIDGSMTLGNFTAFTNYLGILIFPIIIIGFMSNVISRAQASYARVYATLHAPENPETGTIEKELEGAIALENISLSYGEKSVLKDISFEIKPGTRNAIIGPTAAGKTQLLYILIGLLTADKGAVLYDGNIISDYKKATLHSQVGFVFQDSIIFNISLRENIAFSPTVTDEALQRAIDTAELSDFVSSLPQGLDTVVSERGTSLSGGQKQRIMLARALALNPKVLLLDDFTARVDTATEKKILSNVAKNYPHLTLISVTQKIAPIENYDQIILLMEGEILAKGKHDELMHSSPEYVQIFNSQRSTSAYELQS